MSEKTSPVIVIAIDIADPALADRLALLLGGVTGIRLAGPGEAATLAVVSPTRWRPPSRWTSSLPRERDVLALMAEGDRTRALRGNSEYQFHTAKFHVGSLLEKLDQPAAPTPSRAPRARHYPLLSAARDCRALVGSGVLEPGFRGHAIHLPNKAYAVPPRSL